MKTGAASFVVEVFGVLKEKNYDQVERIVLGHGPSAAFHWPEEALRPELTQAKGWGLWHDHELQAFVLWRDIGTEAEITCLATNPSCARKGRMKALLQKVFDANSYKFWLLEVHESNRGARALYESLEFAEVGRRPRYYRDGGAAILYQREGKSSAAAGGGR